MSHHNRRGFTLVELLVVITIIAMLAALLLPAINRAREAGRRTQCLNNCHELSMGVLQFETDKQRMPGYKSYLGAATPKPLIVGWVPPLLPYFGKNDLYALFNTNTSNTAPPAFAMVTADILLCPSDSQLKPAGLSYVTNGGLPDTGGGGMADTQATAVFFDRTVPTPISTSTSYIHRHDGTATTIMLAENVDADTWTEAPSQPEWLECVVWDQSGTPTVTFPLNQGMIGAATSIQYARPSSKHIAGFHLAFCDGHVKFFNEDLDYGVYARLMTPDGPSITGAPFQATPIQESALPQ